MSENHPVRRESSQHEFPQYAFHDPEFVEWWLGSLYMLPAADQIAIAEILDLGIHAPKVKAVLDNFIRDLHPEAIGPNAMHAGVQVDAPPSFEGTFVERSIQFARYHVVAYWRTNPWMVVIAASGLVFAVGRGVWFVAKEFFRIVF